MHSPARKTTQQPATVENSSASIALLVAGARAGDKATQGQLLETFRNYLKLMAQMQLDRPLQAKVGVSDVVQHTFLEAARDFGQFRGHTEAELAGWLRQILARNLADEVRRYRKTQGRNVDLELSLEHKMDVSSAALQRAFTRPSTSPSEAAMRREAAVLLADALAQLPDDYRQVVVLRHLKSKTFPEVAAEMDRTLDSVKNIWTRAMTRLRTHLGSLP